MGYRLISQFGTGVLLLAIWSLFNGCKEKPVVAPPDPNIQLRRELMAFRIACNNGMSFYDFRKMRQSLETEMDLRERDLTTTARRRILDIELDFDHAQHFWAQELVSPLPRMADKYDKATIKLWLKIDVDEYRPSDLVRAYLDKAKLEAEVVLREIEPGGRKR